jgi:flagellar basal body-associated protein FliL
MVKIMKKGKKSLILLILSVTSSIIVIFLYFIGFNIFSTPKLTPSELLEQQLNNDNESINIDDGTSLVDVFLEPKLSYFQFVLSFSSNFKGDNNIMNMELALSTFEGENYHARLTHHEPALRRVVLDTMSETEEDLVRTKKGKEALALTLLLAINNKLESLQEEPAIEEVHFSSFAIR